MAHLVDTNVVSELRKPKPDRGVLLWIDSVPDSDLYLSVLTLGELRRGVQQILLRDVEQGSRLDAWLDEIHERFEGRLVDVDRNIADRWGQLTALRPLPLVDGLIAATALEHGLNLVTRNLADFQNIDGLSVLNPWLG